MSTYAIAHIRDVAFGTDIVEYLLRIDAALADFEGRFVVHGEEAEVVEGHWPDNVLMIGFPDRERAGAWYDSPAYQAILPLRTDNSVADVIFVNGVADGYRAADRMADPAAGPGTGRAADEAAE